MASLAPDIISRDAVVEQYAKEAMNIVFSLPELSPDEQALRLINSVKSESKGVTFEVAKQAITLARKTY
jgi:hypothetical protein